jgi:hypothetical protein
MQPAGAGIGNAARELFELAKTGDLEGLQSLVLALSLGGKGSDVVTLRDPQGRTLLHWAAREGHLEMVKYLVFEANADVLLTCERGLKPAQHAREMWWMKNARLLEAFEFNRDEQARCIQGSIRQTKAREAFGIKHMAACNIQALVRGKLEMLHQKHVWQYSNMWFNPRNYSARMATFAALEANEALAAEALQLAAAGKGGGHGDAALPEFVRVTSANFRRVASLPSAWGGSAQEGRHMLVSMLQAPLRRRLRAGEWEVDLPGGIPPQNLQQYMSHNATVLAAVARRRLALMAYHTARVWLRKTGQTSHQTWANLLALGRRPLVGARRRQQDHNIEKAVAHAMQTALSTAAAAGWTVKNSLTGTTQSASTLPHMPQQEAMGGGAAGGGGGEVGSCDLVAPRFGRGQRPMPPTTHAGTATTNRGGLGVTARSGADSGSMGGGQTQAQRQAAQYDAVTGFLETGTWAGMGAGKGGVARGGEGSLVQMGILQVDVTPIFKNRAYVYRRQAKREQYEAARHVAQEQLRIKTEFEAEKARELAEMNRAASVIQRIYRGGHDRETAKAMAAARKRAHEASLAAIDNKFFSLYDNGVNCLCLHVEWKAEEGLSEPADRWHAVRGNPGGVQGVVVLALRAPAVVREEKRVRAEEEAKAEAARQALWRQMMAEEKKKKQDAATLVMQRCVRLGMERKRAAKKWKQKTSVSVLDRKRAELQGVYFLRSMLYSGCIW